MRRFLTSAWGPATLASLTSLTAATLLVGCGSTQRADPYKIGVLPAADVVAKGRVAGHWVKDGSTLRLVGTVAPGSAAEFAAALTPGTQTVVATVTGGDLGEGLTIARTVRDRKLGLIIDGACAGPCADYWFPAAATRRSHGSGAWLGYVPDLSEQPGASKDSRAAEAKLYADSGVDSAKFHTALDGELRENPGGSAPAAASMWMPDKVDLTALGYPDATLKDMWLPPNLASANAQAHAWGQVVTYKNTLVGLPPVPKSTAPMPPPPAATGN